MSARTYKIAVLAGDGIGPEVMKVGLKVLGGDIEALWVRDRA